MKTNLPVTDREVPFPHGQYLVSQTDLKGRIVDANDAFVEISGFSREELIGASHNIVRHPEMPPAAFADLWATIKAGRPWRGLVKNRCKNGDYYWVDAYVVPVSRDGQITGYMSVRSEPSREAVRQAETHYAAVRAGRQRLKTFSRKAGLSLRARMLIVAIVNLLAISVMVWWGLNGIVASNTALDQMYQQRLQPAVMLGKVVDLLGDNRAQIALGLQHEPGSPFYSMHDHPLSLHTDATLKNRERINTLLAEIERVTTGERERQLLAKFSELRERFSNEGVGPARNALNEGQFRRANELLLLRINPLYAEMRIAADALQKEFETEAAKDFAAAESRYQQVRNQSIATSVLSILLVLLISALTIRRMTVDLNRLRQSMRRIAEGDLSEAFGAANNDELGHLTNEMTIMQTRLKVLLDRVGRAVSTMEEQVVSVREEMVRVTEQSTLQQARVEAVAAATEEFSQSVRSVSESARGTAASAEESRELVNRSTASIEHSVAATERVVGAVRETGVTIDELNSSIARIGDITQTIKEIADQTNLLALNAAIEAARAGEVGRGFAVVADEVWKLAERTGTSTADISSMVDEIQRVTQRAVSAMNRAVSEVEEGVGMMRQSAAGLGDVVSASNAVADQSGRIAAAAEEQALASDEVSNNIVEVSTMVERNVAAAHSVAEACDQLANSASQLRALVAEFKVVRR